MRLFDFLKDNQHNKKVSLAYRCYKPEMSVEGVKGMIDIYDIYLIDGSKYKTIYINMYGTEISQTAPDGFKFK